MALLGNFIDVRTFESVGTPAEMAFAHGLPGMPDFVLLVPIATVTDIGNVVMGAFGDSDATNVTLRRPGGFEVSPFQVVSVVAHSLIR